MATEAQILANQQNSKLSTGPRTEEGKGRSRLNSVKHGLRANVPIMPWETKEAFLAFQNNLMHSLLPEDAMQGFIAEQAVLTAWRLKRASRLEMAYCSPVAPQPDDEPPAADPGNPEPWDDAAILEEMKTFVESTRTSPLPRYEAHLNRQLASYLAQLRLLKKDQPRPERAADKQAPPPPPDLGAGTGQSVKSEFPPFVCVSEEGRKFEAELMQKEHENRLRCLADDAASLREHVAAEAEQREFSDEGYEKGFLANCQLLRISTGLEKQNR